MQLQLIYNLPTASAWLHSTSLLFLFNQPSIMQQIIRFHFNLLLKRAFGGWCFGQPRWPWCLIFSSLWRLPSSIFLLPYILTSPVSNQRPYPVCYSLLSLLCMNMLIYVVSRLASILALQPRISVQNHSVIADFKRAKSSEL